MADRNGRLREHVAEEIRVLLARKKMSGVSLAQAIGVKQPYLSRRLTGEVAFDVDDIEKIADYFEVEPAALIAPLAAGQDTKRYLRRPDQPMPVTPGTRHPGHGRPNGRPQTGQASLTGPKPVRPARLARAATAGR